MCGHLECKCLNLSSFILLGATQYEILDSRNLITIKTRIGFRCNSFEFMYLFIYVAAKDILHFESRFLFLLENIEHFSLGYHKFDRETRSLHLAYRF